MTNFITDNTALPYPKADLRALPGGADAAKYVQAANWNTLCAALADTGNYLRDIFQKTAPRAFTMATRDGVTAFPAVGFRPTSQQVCAFDIMPKGTPSENSGNGYAWMDVVDTDILNTISDPPMQTARVGMRSGFAEFGSRRFGGGALRAVALTIDGTPAVKIKTDSNVQFGSSIIAGLGYSSGDINAGSPAGIFDATDGTVHNLVHVNSSKGVFGTSTNHAIGLWTNGAEQITVSTAGCLTPTKAFATSNELAPPQVTSDQNNYNPTNLANAVVLYIATDASRNITGITSGSIPGRHLYVINNGSFNLVLKHNSGSSSAANKMNLRVAADVTLVPWTGVHLYWSSLAGAWIQIGTM